MDMEIKKAMHLKEAIEVARSRGWDHANFVEAYGPEHERDPEVPPRFADVESDFRSAWEQGVTFFKEGKYPDGSPIEDVSEPERVHEEFDRQRLDDQYFEPPYEDNPFAGMSDED